ncbi:alpha/beta hydrolase [Sphingomonas sp. LB3N6]|uniref:alpha/beta fold hydrolase n=1 Tax=Sphingomonas fucosidasi TaxID=3096164 RepID=UPI002FC68823
MTETLVLLPGLLCDSVIWKHQVEALGATYDVRIADLTGYSSITDMAASVLQAMPPMISVAGHSMGARVAMEMVRLDPTRIARLALLDTGIHPMRGSEVERRHALVELGAREGMRAVALAWLPPMVAKGAFDADPSLQDDLFAMVERMTPAIHRGQIEALLRRPDPRAILPGIRCPVLVGVGELDAWSPPEQHREITNAIAHAQYVVFAGSGHMAPLEAPEQVSRALAAWMEMPVAMEMTHE